jgi:hypothetical protein
VSRPFGMNALHASASSTGAPPTSGYRISDVLCAASEAGIGDEFVARAAAELGLVSGPMAAPPALRSKGVVAVGGPAGIAITSSEDTAPHSWWRGAPSLLDYEVRIEGEASERDLEIAVELIRRSMKQVGVVSRIGRSLSWNSVGDTRKVDLTIVARGGKTVIQASERLSRLAGGLFGGIIGGVGGGGGSLAMAVGMGALNSVPVALAMWLSMVGGSYVLARGIYTSVARDHQQQLRRLVTEIAEYIGDGIDRGSTPILPPGPRPEGMRTPGVGR